MTTAVYVRPPLYPQQEAALFNDARYALCEPRHATKSGKMSLVKRCVRCGLERTREDFYRRASAKDGRASYCKDCQRVYVRGWKQANPERVSAIGRRDYQKHRDAKRAYGAAWREANRMRHAAMVRRWEQANPDRVRAKYARYRAAHPDRVRGLQDARRDSGRRRLANWVRRASLAGAQVPGAPLTPEAVFARFDLYDWSCYYCGVALTRDTAEADHRIPISRGGLNCPANIVPCCQRCNLRKLAKTEREYRGL